MGRKKEEYKEWERRMRRRGRGGREDRLGRGILEEEDWERIRKGRR